MNYEIRERDEQFYVVRDEQENLRARTKTFALRIIRLYCAMPKRPEMQVLGKQVLRSGTSVGANYREAFRARSDGEFIAKMGDCLKELEETAYWLELLSESGLMSSDRLAPLREENSQLIAIFVTIIRRKKENQS